jgi:hypothetical protein
MKWLVLAGLLEACYLKLLFTGDLRRHIAETIGLYLISGLFYLVCCRLVLTGRGPDRRLLLGAALLFRLTVWPLFPALSDDVFRYRWEGVLQNKGGNPYQARPNDPHWAGLRDATFLSVPGRDFKAVYGPLIQLEQRAMDWSAARLSPDPFRQAFWFKLPAALFDLGAITALGFLLRVRALPLDRLLIYAWSPLPVVEFWATGHHDSMVVFLLLASLLAANSGRWNWSCAALALAAAAKLWPALLLPIWIRRGGWRGLWVVPLAAIALAAPYWDSRWMNIEENARFLSGFLSGWRNNDSLFAAVLWIAGGDVYAAKKLALAIAAVAVGVVTWLRWPIERAILTAIAVLLAVSANAFPWYLTWFLPLLAIHPSPGLLLWTALAPIGHIPVIAWMASQQWNGSLPSRWWEYGPVAVVLAWEAAREGKRQMSKAKSQK